MATTRRTATGSRRKDRASTVKSNTASSRTARASTVTPQYAAAPGYDQYGTGPGYVNPETQSEAGRPLHIPAEPLPPVEPVSFAFKRLFTHKWHVYVGLLFLPMLIAMVGGLIFVLPQIINDANNGVEELSTSTNATMTVWQILMSLLSFAFSIVVYKVALRDTRGEKPTWGGAFKGVPWGQAILVYLLAVLAFGLVFIGLALLGGFLAAQVPVLGAIVIVLTMLIGFFSYPFLAMIPLYAIDGKTSATGAFAAAWNDVKAHYWRVLGAIVLVGLLSLALVVFTLGFGLIIVAPLQVLAYVFIYRWISEYGHAGLSAQNTAQPYQHPENPQNPQNPGEPGGYMTMY